MCRFCRSSPCTLPCPWRAGPERSGLSTEKVWIHLQALLVLQPQCAWKRTGNEGISSVKNCSMCGNADIPAPDRAPPQQPAAKTRLCLQPTRCAASTTSAHRRRCRDAGTLLAECETAQNPRQPLFYELGCKNGPQIVLVR